MAGVDIPRDRPTVEYGVVLQVCVADDLFDLEVQRAPDSGGSPDLGNIDVLYENLSIPQNDTRVIYDYVPDQNQIYWYRFRSVRINWNDGDWTDWYSVKPDVMPLEEGIATRTPCSSLGTRWMWVEYDIIEATNQAVFSWVGSDLVTEVEIWEDTTLDGEPDAIIANGDGLARIGTYTVESVTVGYRKTFWFYSYFADGEILVQEIKVSRLTGGDPDNYGNLILNPDFEQSAAYWKADAVGDAAIETVGPLAGAKSLNVITNGASSAFVSQVSRVTDDIDSVGTYIYRPVAAGETYRVIATGKVDAAAAPLKVDIRFADDAKAELTIATAITFTETSETRKSGYFTVPDDGSLWMTVQFRMDTDASSPRDGYVDDIYITAVTGIIPTVQEDITYDGAGNATLTLTMSDPESRITQVEFNTKSGLAAWSGFAVDTAPYAATVALTDKHDSHIAYKITYTAPDGSTGYITANVTVDIDLQPEMTTPWLTIDDTWNVWMSHSGDDDTDSVKYETDTTDQPTRGEVQSSGTVINARQAKTQIHTGLAEDETLYVSVLAYSQTGGAGTESVVMHELQITRQIDEDTDEPSEYGKIIHNNGFENGGRWWYGPTGAAISAASPIAETYSLAITAGGAERWVRQVTDVQDDITLGVDEEDYISVEEGDYMFLAAYGATTGATATVRAKTYDKDKAFQANINFFTFTSGTPERKKDYIYIPTGIEYVVVEFAIAAGSGVAKFDNVAGYLFPPRIPTIKEIITYPTAASGKLEIEINAAQAVIISVEMKKYEDQTWDAGWTDVEPSPYDMTVALSEKHPSAITYRVGYDLTGTGEGTTEYLENSVAFDLDTLPELGTPSFDVDPDTGIVTLAWSGDDDVGSIMYETAATDWGSDAAARTAAQGGTAVNNRSGKVALSGAGLPVPESDVVYVAILAYTGASGSGTESIEVYRATVTRGASGIIVPTIQSQMDYSGSNGTITLVVNDPQTRVTLVQWAAKSGPPGTAWGSWTTDTGPPPTYNDATVALDEKYDSNIRWQVSYTDPIGTKIIEGNVTFDVDRFPEIGSFGLSIDDAGVATLNYHGDDDVGSIKWSVSTSVQPNATTVRAESCPGNCNDARSEGALDVGAGTISEGDTLFCSFFAYTGAGASGTESAILYECQDTRATTASNPIYDVSGFARIGISGAVTLRWAGTDAASISYISNTTGFGTYAENINDSAWASPDGTNNKWSSSVGGAVTSIEQVASGETAYIAFLGWSGAGGTGTRSASVFTVEVTHTAGFYQSDSGSPPSSPQEGDRWWQTDTFTMWIYRSGVWKQSWSGPKKWVGVPPTITYSTTEPTADLANGDIWYDTTSTPWVKYVRIAGTFVDIEDRASGAAPDFALLSAAGNQNFTQPITFIQGAIVKSSTNNPVVEHRADNMTIDRTMGPGFYDAATRKWSYTMGGDTPGAHGLSAVDNIGLLKDGTGSSLVWEVGYSDRVVDFKVGPTVNGVALAVTGSLDADTLDTKDSTEFAILDTASTFTAAQTINAATPILWFKDTADSLSQVGPAWIDAAGSTEWSFYFDGNDLSIYNHNASPVPSVTFALGTNVATFNQRPQHDANQLAAAVDDIDFFDDVNYTTAPTVGQVLLWDNGNQYWEPSDVPAASLLSSIGDVNSGYVNNDFLFYTGGAWTGQTRAELNIARTNGVNTFTGAQTINAADPRLIFRDTVDSLDDVGPQWFDAANNQEWGWRFDGNDLWLYNHNGTPVSCVKFDLSSNNAVFNQRPFWDSNGIAVASDDLDYFSDVNYASGLTGGDVMTWDAGNGWWEPIPPTNPSHALSAHSDVNTSYGANDFLYNVGGTWTGRTIAELNLVHDTSISVQDSGSHKGYLGNDNDINFINGANTTAVVVDAGAAITVKFDAELSSLTSPTSINIFINDDGGSDAFFIKTGSTPATIARVTSGGDLFLGGNDLHIGDAGGSTTGDSGRIISSSTNFDFYAIGGQNVRLRTTSTSDRFYLYNGTWTKDICNFWGSATGSGSPGAVDALYGSIYVRY